MELFKEEIGYFFDQYAARFNDALNNNKLDVQGTINSFTSCFVAASPLGVNCGKNDSEFEKAIPKGYDFYRSIGVTSMEITNREITILDDYHAMVKVFWHSLYHKQTGGTIAIDFAVIYFLQKIKELRIFAYITGDEQKALKEHGLI